MLFVRPAVAKYSILEQIKKSADICSTFISSEGKTVLKGV
jgi:hypothetical protein